MSDYIASGLAELGTGFMDSYNKTLDRRQRQQQIDEEIAWKREQRQAERAKMAQDNELRVSLANAARPAQVDAGYQVTDTAGSNAFTKDADAAAMMGDMVAEQRPSLASATRVQGTAYRDPKQAQAAQSQYNSAPATLDRMGLAAMPYDADKGLSLQGQASTARKTATEEQKKLQAEVDDRFNNEITSIAMSGPKWWEAAATMYTNSNMPGLQGVEVGAELSKDGKSVTFLARSPDGTVKKVNTFEASEKGAQDWAQASAKVDSKTKLAWLNDRAKYLREADQATAKIAARGDQERQTIDYKRTTGDGKESVGREERLRYTSLFQDAGRRQAEAQKTLSTLMKERSYANAKPGSPQAEELASVREAIKQYGDERKTYQSLLADGASKGTEKPPASAGLSDVRAPSVNRSLASTDAEKDRYAILQRELESATAEGRKQDVIALQNEISRLPKSTAAVGLSAMRQPARQAAGQPVKVTTKAERDALPAGTQYIDPNGQVFVKK